MNIFIHELKSYRKSTIIWSFSLIAISLIFLSMFPSFSNDAEQFKKLLQSYPEALLKAFGIIIDTITSFLGFYSYIFMYITLCGAIQAMNLGTSIISKEVREKTADFLLTKPISRLKIITSKLLAAITSLVITNIFYLICVTFIAYAVTSESFDLKIFLMISITVFFTQLIFLAFGVLISVLIPKIKSVIPISLTTVLSFYIIGMLGSVIGEKNIRYITPFKYYEPMYIIKNTSYEATFIIIEAIFVILAIASSYIIYIKKDIHAV